MALIPRLLKDRMKQINITELYIYDKDDTYLGSANFACMLDWPTSEIITSEEKESELDKGKN